MPVLHIAHMRQRPTHKPRKQTPAQSPEDKEEAIDRDVEAWVQARAAVEEDGEGQGGDREEGGCCQLQRSISATFTLYALVGVDVR